MPPFSAEVLLERCQNMNQIELQGKSIEALKSFNNTIVTSRLYPPEAPQVATAVDRGYKNIKQYLRLHGNLTFSMRNGELCLSGQVLDQEVLDLFPNLVVYRQLGLLGLLNLVIRSEMDRFAFGQLLAVFNASVEKIKKEGGGLEYITSLGLASYFPEALESRDEGGQMVGHQGEPQTKKLLNIRPEIVACLFGKDKRQVVENELRQKMAAPESAIDVLAASVAYILRDIQKIKKIVASEKFPRMLERAERRIEREHQLEVARGMAKVLVEQLQAPALCVLSVQEYPEGFGSKVYTEFITLLPTEKLAGIMVLLREQLAKAERLGGVSAPQVQFFGKALKKLISSEKGKHVLSTEKAKHLIHEGERERKKRRLEAGITGLLQGNINLLKSEELVLYLPAAVSQLLQKPEGDEASLIIGGMIEYLRHGDEGKRDSLLKSMAAIGESLMATSQWQYVDLLLRPLMEEVRNGTVGDELVENIVMFLQQVMQKSWHDEENDRGDRILSLFHQIRSGQIPLPASVRNIVAKVQDRGIRRASLPKLLEQCLATPKDETLSYRLILQGPVALRFLVESLINTNDATHRLKIIDLLTYSPHFLPSVVHERLKEHMPWYGKRNLIKLLGETGSEEDADALLPYLRHDDFRVQRETFLSLYKIGGNNRKQLLVKALDYSSDPIKLQIVMALGNFCDSDVAPRLVELLLGHESFIGETRNDLMLQLLDTLGRCPCNAAQKGLTAFLQTRGQRQTKKIPETIWAAAEKALKFVHNELQETRKKHIQASKLRKNALKQAAKIKKTGVAQRAITGLPQEQAIRAMVSRGEKAAATDQLLDLIERTARMRNFVQAEKLREWLIEIDPTALGMLVRAAEIISHEKRESIDNSNVEVWSELYDILTTDEFSVVYNALKQKKYDDAEIIIRQGAVQSSLFFINSGKVKLFFDDSNNEVLVSTMEAGQVFGGDSVFEASIWTVSVAAVGAADISVLKLETMQQWCKDFPELEKKLHEFCKKFERVESAIRKSAKDRRKHKRYRISGRLNSTLLDSRGRSIGTDFMVDFFDISEGGLSCLVRIPESDNARLLLGRKMQLILPKQTSSGSSEVLVGDILAVKRTMTALNEYSLHVKFDAQITRNKLHDILMIMREEAQVSK